MATAVFMSFMSTSLVMLFHAMIVPIDASSVERLIGHGCPESSGNCRSPSGRIRLSIVTSTDLYALPPNLPVPLDDGACEHLDGAVVPPVRLRSSSGRVVDVSTLGRAAVLYLYPRISPPDRPIPAGWDEMPGARGCTPQSCRYRDLHPEFAARGIQLFGVSTQSPRYQRDMVERLRLPYELLSDGSSS